MIEIEIRIAETVIGVSLKKIYLLLQFVFVYPVIVALTVSNVFSAQDRIYDTAYDTVPF